jgi:hypothetical protein
MVLRIIYALILAGSRLGQLSPVPGTGKMLVRPWREPPGGYASL